MSQTTSFIERSVRRESFELHGQYPSRGEQRAKRSDEGRIDGALVEDLEEKEATVLEIL